MNSTRSTRSPRPRPLKALIAVAAAALVLTGCSAQGATGDSGGDASKTIGISFPNYSRTPSLQAVVDAAQAEADAKGYTLVLDDPEADLDKQVSTIRTWIPQNYGAIITVALDSTVFEGVAKEAMDAGVKWLTYGTALENQDGQIDLDQVAGGKALGTMAAEWFNENMAGTGKVALLTYEEGEWSRERRQGIEDALSSLAPGVEVVAQQDALSETEGLDATANLLQAHPDLNGVLGILDSATVGAYGALPDKKSPTFFVGGIDGSLEALEAIDAGDNAYRASAALDLNALGAGMVDAAIELIEGTGSGNYKVTYLSATHGSEDLATALKMWTE